jgi:nucleoside-diphosphate-sugar epimerase
MDCMVKVLVTGAVGNAGQAVTRLLAGEGFSVETITIRGAGLRE